MGCPNVTDDTRDDYPQFPCPHPKASASYNIPWATFKRSRSSLEKVARQIQTALEANGYYELRWFSVKDGFAVMTRMEQFQKNGKSLSGRDRWSEEIHVPFWDSLWGQKKGFFRCIVFIVTTEVLKGTRTKFDIARLNGLFSRGVQAGFPRGLASIPFANSHNCIALIYEFEKYPESSGMIFNTGSELQGKTHLEKAGILKALKEKNDRKQK
jgi:hypothetical protein